MKIILVVIDGLGDEAIPRLGNKTPLEAAKTPNLDFLANNGVCGQVKPFLFSWQKYPTSDTCHLALFGYPPKKYYLGRGVYETAGVGMEMKEGDVALRVNFGAVNQKLRVIDRRAGRIENTEPLIKALGGLELKGVRFLIKKSGGHRAGLILRSKNKKIISAKISDGDPKEIGLRVKKITALENSPEARFTADILNKFLEKAHQVLKNQPLNKKRIKNGLLPANYLLVRGPGKMKKTPPFSKRYHLKPAFIAAGGLYKGIARILGMTEIKVKGISGLANTNLKGKFLGAKKAAKQYNFIFLHIKAADSLSEDGDFAAKKKFIEKIDKNLKEFKNIKGILIVVTGDHSTCSLLRKHCNLPNPILIYGAKKGKGKEGFSEKACQRGKLGKFPQIELMPKILNYARRLDSRNPK